jgi:hypothetical protein
MLMLVISEHLLAHNTESMTEKVGPNCEIETKGGAFTGKTFFMARCHRKDILPHQRDRLLPRQALLYRESPSLINKESERR